MNSEYNADVIVIGAGGGGSVAAKELGEKGIKVLLLDAGPWYGNSKWPEPNRDPGAVSSSGYGDLNIDLLKQSFTDLEDDMNNLVYGKFRWGPADRSRSPWPRQIEGGGIAWQNSGIGGSTLHYFGNSPRAYPEVVDNVWPISYQELAPYYEKVEATLPVHPGATTTKEELFYYGAKKAGWKPIDGLDITTPGYRPQPNAILQVNPLLQDPAFDIRNNRSVGCTLRGHCVNGCHIGPTIEGVAKRSTLVSYIPRALRSGNVEVMPNTFVTKILTTEGDQGVIRASGVGYRNTWTGETGELRARVVVMSCGAVESPRLWLNSGLPQNEWVGKGLVNHWMDCISGIFDEYDLLQILGSKGVFPYVGQNSGARFDYPGLGSFEPFGFSPGLSASMLYGNSESGFSVFNTVDPQAPWDEQGMIAGEQLKEFMRAFDRTLSILILTDDEALQSNGVSLSPEIQDENGYIPVIHNSKSEQDSQKREQLAVIAADILRQAGAKTVIRANLPQHFFVHMLCTMRMGLVTDTNCEAYQVKGLFIADNSVLYNGIGGPNPTLTTQALAARTADRIAALYFA